MEMNQQQALGILVQAVRLAQSKGVYTLEDAEVIAKAVKLFTPVAEEKAEGAEEVKAEEVSA